MLDFKKALNSYLRLKLRLQEIKNEADQMSFGSYGQEERIRTEVAEIMRQYEPARATEILDEFEQKTVYTVPPPLTKISTLLSRIRLIGYRVLRHKTSTIVVSYIHFV